MYHNRKLRKNNLLQISDNFATLVNVHSPIQDDRSQSSRGELQFEFRYSISQIKAIQENTFSVLITVKNKQKSRHIITPSTKLGAINADQLIDNIVLHKTKIINSNIAEKDSFILQKSSDISSRINNHILSVLKSGEGLEKVGLQKTKLVVSKTQEKSLDSSIDNKSNVVLPNLGHSSLQDQALDESVKHPYDEKKLRLNLLNERSLSPSMASMLSQRSLTPHVSLKGIIRKNSYNEYVGDPLTKIVNSYLFEGQGGSLDSKNGYSTSVEQVFDDTITITEKVAIQDFYSSIESTVIVKFELMKTTILPNGTKQNIPVEIIEKDLNLQEQIKNYYTPKVPPSVSIFSSSQDVVIQIKQNDQVASGAKIYKKVINDQDYSLPYVLIDSVKLSSANGIGRYKYTNSNDENTIYRVVPYSIFSPNSFQEFTDVVIKKPRKSGNKKLVLVPRLTPEGINCTAYSKFPNIVAARLMLRDVTIRQKDFVVTNCIFNFSSREQFDTSVIKSDRLTPYHVYELTTKLIDRNGIESLSSHSSLIEYVPYAGNVLDVKIENVDSSNNDMRFSITTNLITDQIGLLQTLLSKTSATYDIEALKQRTAIFDKLIAYNVLRHNITTGDVEDMGIIAGGTTFTDSVEALKRNATSIKNDNDYQYCIYPLLRDPESVSSTKDSSRSEIRDEETRKIYKINPRKHYHPLTLIKGSVVSQKFIDNDTKNDMLYGSMGMSYYVNSSYKTKNPTINNFLVKMFDEKRVILNWIIQGNPSKIDHFIIMREVDNVRTIIGKSHAIENNSSFIHDLTPNDIGYATYLLVAVYQDYSSSSSFRSNSLLISF